MNWSPTGVTDEYFAHLSHLTLGLRDMEDRMDVRGGQRSWLMQNAGTAKVQNLRLLQMRKEM